MFGLSARHSTLFICVTDNFSLVDCSLNLVVTINTFQDFFNVTLELEKWYNNKVFKYENEHSMNWGDTQQERRKNLDGFSDSKYLKLVLNKLVIWKEIKQRR